MTPWKFILVILSGILVGALGTFIICTQKPKTLPSQSLTNVSESARLVESNLSRFSDRFRSQMDALCTTVAHDGPFALKLFVENDRNAPEVSDFAGKFIEPMAIDLLEITDSAFAILSSGPYGAALGTIASIIPSLVDDGEVQCVIDTIRGHEVLALEYQKKVSISDAIVHVRGGLILDDDFLDAIRPSSAIKIGIKRGNTISVRSLASRSDAAIDNGKLQIDKSIYVADTLALPYRGVGAIPCLLILTRQ